MKTCIALVALFALHPCASNAQENTEELAMQLANPVASLISVPLQLNVDGNIGPDDGFRSQVNIQPVIPTSIGNDWNLISRVILPVVQQNDVFGNSGRQFGLGDTLASFFFSPKAGSVIWGVGPALLMPTGTERLLTGDKWAAGPTGVVLKQSGSWTYGALANHLWSFAGDDARSHINQTFAQPFLSYTTRTAVTYSMNAESTYNWRTEELTIPINVSVSRVTRFGNQLVSIGGGLRYWAKDADGSPEGLGARLVVTLLFPK